MATSLRATVSAVFGALVVTLWVSASLAAAPQEPAQDPAVSLDRIREGLARTPPAGLKLDMPQQPLATFKTKVEQRVWVLPLKEWLEAEFKMTAFERQSAEWSAKCCGLSLDTLFKSLDDALERRKVRKIREQIARELAELEAARTKANLPEKR